MTVTEIKNRINELEECLPRFREALKTITGNKVRYEISVCSLEQELKWLKDECELNAFESETM